jgi:hypothetical protein
VDCHNPSEARGKLDLTRRSAVLVGGKSGPAIVPGKSTDSQLFERVRAGEMPPRKTGRKLSVAEIATLARWLDAGAPWPAERVLSSFEITTDQRAGLDWWSLQPLARPQPPSVAGEDTLTARLRSYELAGRMQASIPAALDFSRESAETRRLYGLEEPTLAPFARNCLLARRLLEAGVRFVQLYNGGALGSPRINWDAHEDVKDNHQRQGHLLDRPVAGLLRDLSRRGLLDDTLVYWSSEFGRTPFTEGIGARGRDHHPLTFTAWLAGAGLKKGITFGESDELGYKPAGDPVTVYDLHATILQLLGLDHTRLTYYHNGIQRRLTDVHGHVIDAILA